MPRIPRQALPDGIFHVTSRGVARSPIFRDPLDYLALRSQLREVMRKFAWNVYAYCLMPNHYHLIVETDREHLSAGMHRLNFLYAQRFNRRHDRAGHLFQNRFAAYVIESDEHLLNSIGYVSQNPVRAGLCDAAADWPWAASAFAPD
jgi:REP element-mobilizing transposase RayT